MKKLLFIFFLLALGLQAFAQHEHHQHQEPVKKPAPKRAATKKPVPARTSKSAPPKDTNTSVQNNTDAHAGHSMADTPVHHSMDEHAGHNMADTAMAHSADHSMHDMASMSHAYSINLPMTRNGSGTGWLPDASPMFGYMMHSRKWMYMIHGSVFLRYNKQDLTGKGTRGNDMIDAPNMLMFMGQRRVGQKGLFHFSSMISFDNLVTGGAGYPLLFQSGETFEGQPLIDRQHPHDLFSELSISYAHAFNKDVDAFVYLGYPGEPALGPVTFMHRPSGWDNPDAPLSHHWIDATHITFGVATLGLRYRQFKLEASSFTGREPGENRYNFDKPLFDSRSVRLSMNPTKNWALQVSHAFIKSPEALHPHNIYRTTASATYAYRFAKGALFNATALWGMNKEKNHDGEHATLLEGSLRKGQVVGYTRYEWVQKSGEELNLDEDIYGHDAIFPVNAFTLGAAYDVLQLKPVRLSIGAQASIYCAPSSLDALYGNNPMAGEIYLRLYPNLMQ